MASNVASIMASIILHFPIKELAVPDRFSIEAIRFFHLTGLCLLRMTQGNF